MANKLHVHQAALPPSSAPTIIGEHWVDTSTKRQYFSVGTDSVDDWVLVPQLEDAINDAELYKAPTQNAVFDALAGKEATGTAAAAVAAHEAASDPHPQYFDDTAFAAHLAASDPHPGYATDADLSAHVAAGDPHPVYATDADLTAGLATKANTSHTHVAADVTDFTEAAQDAVGGGLLATASVNPTYNDSGNQFSWAVLPAGVDHNSLSNFVANKHIDHTSVNIDTAATSGLSGGGDISSTRTLVQSDTRLTSSDRIAPSDEIGFYDLSATANRKLTLAQWLARRGGVTDQSTFWYTDFIIEGATSLNEVGAGTGNSSQRGTYGMNTTEKALGIWQTDTGTTAAGRRTVASDVTSLTTGLSRLRTGMRYALEQLSNGTDTFTSYIGFINNTGSGAPTAGAYFQYTHGTNSGKWQCVTAEGGASPTRTTTDSGVTADTVYNIFEVEIADDNTSAKFYINDVLVQTITTTIPPTSATNNTIFGFGHKVEKSVGTTAIAVDLDWIYIESERTAAR